MKFKDDNGNIIYCKNNSYNNFNNRGFYKYKNIQYYNGYQIHKEDGPAIKFTWGSESWYLNGNYYRKEEYQKIMNLKNKQKVLNEI